MRLLIFNLLLFMFLASSCGDGNNQKLETQLLELDQKEQELIAWEVRLKAKEDSLSKIRSSIDSTNFKTDSANIYNSDLVGSWRVNMICTETSCEGSAIGDTKNEKWNISYREKTVVVKAMANNQVIRSYTGFFKNNELQLKADNPSGNTIITATLQLVNEKAFEGVREIVRKEECRTVYSTRLEKL